jgi:HAD superfamily hydrolase (TIGR01509 family)
MSSLPAAVLWDLDGTLIDTEPYWIAGEYELVTRYGGQWSDADAHSIIGYDLVEAAKVLRDRGGVNLPPQQIVDELVAGVVARIRQHMPWRPGAPELLGALNRSGVPCALVTMSWRPIADEVVRQLPPGTFQAIITGDMVMNGKPHPEPYRRAAEELGVDPLACVAIEDSPTGVTSAERAGCVVVAVPNLVPIARAEHRISLPSLVGVTPEQLGEYVESTPPPPSAQPSAGRPRRPSLPWWREWRSWLPIGGRRWAALAAAGVVLLGGLGVWWFAVRDGDEPFRPGAFRVHAWVPPWELEDALDEFASNATLFQQVSPFWYQVTGLTSIGLYENISQEATGSFLEEARERGIPLVASLADATAPNTMAAILADPASRTAHVGAIAAFAANNDFAGIDINYERFAFDDGRDTWADTRPNWVAFITELGERLHTDGRMLTVSVPPVYDDERTGESGYWVYDYGAIVDHVDAIRMMAYDFSTSEPGPISPLPWVASVIEGGIDAAGDPDKLVLGVPLYGRNWVIATTGECPESAPGNQSPRLNAIPDLIERREADPVYDPVNGEWSFTYQVEFTEGEQSCLQTREVHYADSAGVRERMQMSVDNGLLGVALFAFGYQSEDVFTAIEEIDATLPGASEPPATS